MSTGDVKTRLAKAADQLHDKAVVYAATGRTLVLCLSPEGAELLSKWLRAEAEDAAACDAINSRDPDNPGKTRVMLRPQAGHALALADHILGRDAAS